MNNIEAAKAEITVAIQNQLVSSLITELATAKVRVAELEAQVKDCKCEKQEKKSK